MSLEYIGRILLKTPRSEPWIKDINTTRRASNWARSNYVAENRF
jgi:hypothetical protein